MNDDYLRSPALSAIEDITLGHPEYAPDSADEDGPPHPASVWVRRVTPAMRVVWEQHSPESAPHDGTEYVPDNGVEPTFSASVAEPGSPETTTVEDGAVARAVDAILQELRARPPASAAPLNGAPAKVYVRPKEYAAYRDLSLSTVEKMIREGLPIEGEGSRRRIHVERADEWLRAWDGRAIEEKARAAALRLVAKARRS
jgi:hypothetical protein